MTIQENFTAAQHYELGLREYASPANGQTPEPAAVRDALAHFNSAARLEPANPLYQLACAKAYILGGLYDGTPGWKWRAKDHAEKALALMGAADDPLADQAENLLNVLEKLGWVLASPLPTPAVSAFPKEEPDEPEETFDHLVP